MKLANYNLLCEESGENFEFDNAEEAIVFDGRHFGEDEEERKEKRILSVRCRCEKCGCECLGNINTQDSFHHNYSIDELCPECNTMNLKEF